LAVYEERWLEAPAGPLCVYLHGLSDPGNIGTILRSAEAFGATCVALGPGTADPFSPKAVRASMGAVFAVPLAKVEVVSALPGAKVALVAGEGVPLHGLWRSRHEGVDGNAKVSEITLLIGAERDGLPSDVIGAADLTAHIPIKTHSLNAAQAATVALYELTSRMARDE
jgi:TrmH family RNA methyltransferase